MTNSDEFLLKVKNFLENLGYHTPVYMLVWTTTPWTLVANLALAINKDIEYCAFICDDSFKDKEPSLFIASKAYFDKQKQNHWFLGGFKLPLQDINDKKGKKIGQKIEDGFINQLKLGILKNYFPNEKDFSSHYKKYLSDSALHYLANKDSPKSTYQYQPIFPYFKDRDDIKQSQSFSILHGNFVSTEEGTGIVHIAPGFGEDDQILAKSVGIPTIRPVDEGGKFTDEIYDLPYGTK